MSKRGRGWIRIAAWICLFIFIIILYFTLLMVAVFDIREAFRILLIRSDRMEEEATDVPSNLVF